MVICDDKCIRQISQYLQVPIGKLSSDSAGNISATNGPKNAQNITGFGTIVLSLAKACKKPLFGKNKEDEALVRQWIEYTVCYVNHMDCSSAAQQILKELNSVLADQVYLVSNYKTLADIVMYYALYNYMVNLSLQDKEQHLHLSRWFNNIQQDPELRQKNKLLCFSRTLLYT